MQDHIRRAKVRDDAKDDITTAGGSLPSWLEAAELDARAEACTGAVVAAMLPFLTRDDGWLRICGQHDGDTVYFKWKWTAGPHVNHYVMTVYPYHDAAEALGALARKVDAVDAGRKAPVRDHYFK